MRRMVRQRLRLTWAAAHALRFAPLLIRISASSATDLIGCTSWSGAVPSVSTALAAMRTTTSWRSSSPSTASHGSGIREPTCTRRSRSSGIRYRSSHAHFAPRLARGEPARLDLGLFELGRGTEATCLLFDETEFLGVVHYPGGGSVTGRYRLEDDRLLVWWSFRGCEADHTLATAGWRDWLPKVPFSPGYGAIEPGGE